MLRPSRIDRVFLALILGGAAGPLAAENVDPGNDGSQFAYAENLGWINAEPQGDGGPGVQVGDSTLTGWMWGENVGWISLSCQNTGSCSTTTYGVGNDGSGVLSGYAWGENIGWVSFSCQNTSSCAVAGYGVSINPFTGEFSGSAWSENGGWITFASTGSNPYRVRTSWKCTDADADGSCVSNDCNDADQRVFPGAPQVCDGLNNDCAHPSWPALPANEADVDGDGFSQCAGDCADGNADTYPGAPEVNDGLDNQCPGNRGFGVRDEITGALLFTPSGSNIQFCWPAQEGATLYQVARSPLRNFSAACVTFTTGAPCLVDPVPPPLGAAFYYLVRPLAPHAGSWGQDSRGVERILNCGGGP